MVVGGSNFHILVDMSGSSVMVSQSGQRSLWSDMPQVTSSSLLSAVSPQIRRLQVRWQGRQKCQWRSIMTVILTPVIRDQVTMHLTDLFSGSQVWDHLERGVLPTVPQCPRVPVCKLDQAAPQRPGHQLRGLGRGVLQHLPGENHNNNPVPEQ